jgi:hypothetical protein
MGGNNRIFGWTLRLLALPFLCEAAIAQQPPAAPPAAPAPISRSADGHPNLEGVWEFRWRTFLARPPGMPAVVDAAGARAAEAGQIAFFRSLPGNANPESDTDFTTFVRVRGEYRTSLIIDPPDGQLPWTEAARPPAGPPPDVPVNNPEERAHNERCIASAGFPVIPVPTNNYIQVIQTPDTLVFIPEALGDVRRLSPGAEPAAADVKSRWEGDTLVVETRNFGRFMRFTQPGTMVAFSPATTVRETYTPVSADEITYRFTVTDPTLHTRPWTAETTWVRSRDRLYEYACHEANYALTNMLKAGRVRDGRPSPPQGRP